MATAPHNPARIFARLAAVSLGLAALFAILASGPARAIGGGDNVAALLLGTFAAVIGSLLAALPPAVCFAAAPQAFAMAALAGLIVRFLATMTFAFGLFLLHLIPGDGLLVWAAIAQLVLLAGDVSFLIWLAKGREAKTA